MPVENTNIIILDDLPPCIPASTHNEATLTRSVDAVGVVDEDFHRCFSFGFLSVSDEKSGRNASCERFISPAQGFFVDLHG